MTGRCYNLQRGIERRAQMMEILRQHPEGLPSSELSAAVGLTKSMGRHHTRFMPVLMRGNGNDTMYFHPDHKEEADAYSAARVKLDHSVRAEKERRILEFVLSRPKSSTAEICAEVVMHRETAYGVLGRLREAGKVSKTIIGNISYWHKPDGKIHAPRVSAKTRILDLLGQHVSLHRERICRILDLSDKRAGEALYELTQAGLVVVIKDGVGRENNRRAWCLPEHAEKVRQAALEAMRAQLKAGPKPRAVGPQGPTVCNVEPVILPGFTARSFRSDNPEPLFSSLKPGQYPSQPTTAYARSL